MMCVPVLRRTPRYAKDVRGDHYVTLVVQVPDKLSNEAKELLRKFDEATDNSLNTVKNAQNDNAEDEPKDGKDGKKKKFWK